MLAAVEIMNHKHLQGFSFLFSLSLSLSCCTHDQSGDEYIVYTLYIHGTCCILNSGNVLFVVRSNIL